VNKRAAIFIDRDGTLNTEVDYLHKPEDVAIAPSTATQIAILNKKNVPVIVITNQSGIGKGKFGWDDYNAVMEKIDELLAQHEAHLDDAYVCPYHEDAIGEYRHPNHPDRKPNPGMLLRAAEKHCIDLKYSWMAGDKKIDMEAAHNAGCRAALVRTGYGNTVDPELADLVADDLGGAIKQILSLGLINCYL